MDLIIEQLVKQESNYKVQIKKLCAVLVSLLITIMVIRMSYILHASVTMLLTLIILLCCATAVFIKKQQVEFEYSIVNNEFTVDKIINKKKRKHVITFSLQSINKAGLYQKGSNQSNSKKLIKACVNENSNSTYFLNFRHSHYGDTTLLVSPNEKIINVIKRSSVQ